MARLWKIGLVLLTVVAAASVRETDRVAGQSSSNPAEIFKQYCIQCHG
jgi:mono/diheme cytochrome c family protein